MKWCLLMSRSFYINKTQLINSFSFLIKSFSLLLTRTVSSFAYHNIMKPFIYLFLEACLFFFYHSYLFYDPLQTNFCLQYKLKIKVHFFIQIFNCSYTIHWKVHPFSRWISLIPLLFYSGGCVCMSLFMDIIFSSVELFVYIFVTLQHHF